jgi:hypothetical protein
MAIQLSIGPEARESESVVRVLLQERRDEGRRVETNLYGSKTADLCVAQVPLLWNSGFPGCRVAP